MIGVKGWYSANCLMPCPIFAAGTTALLTNGSRSSGTTVMPADSGVFAAIPSPTVSQAAANAAAAAIPIAPSQSMGLAGDRNPSAKAIPMMTAMAIALVAMVAAT